MISDLATVEDTTAVKTILVGYFVSNYFELFLDGDTFENWG